MMPLESNSIITQLGFSFQDAKSQIGQRDYNNVFTQKEISITHALKNYCSNCEEITFIYDVSKTINNMEKVI